MRPVSPRLTFYASYHLLYTLKDSNPQPSDSYSDALPIELKVHLVLLVGLEPTSLKGQQSLNLSCIANSTTGAYCVYNGARTHDLWFHKPALCQLSYIHHVKTPSRRRGGSIYNIDLALANFRANLLQTCAARSRQLDRPLGDEAFPRSITLDDSKLPFTTSLIIPIRFWLVPYIGFEPI